VVHRDGSAAVAGLLTEILPSRTPTTVAGCDTPAGRTSDNAGVHFERNIPMRRRGRGAVSGPHPRTLPAEIAKWQNWTESVPLGRMAVEREVDVARSGDGTTTLGGDTASIIERRVSVLICTRDRPESVERAVRAVLASSTVQVEVVVVDQSSGPEAERRLAALGDGRVRYVRRLGGGKPAALNEGLRLVQAPIVVLTDDDCEPPPDWVAGMVRILEARPDVALVFCNVVPPPYDHRLGYVPAYERTTDRLVRSIGGTCWGRGLGAGMAIRRDAVMAIGGFDDAIGPGARFKSGDDWDLELRLLLKGWHVYETASVSTLHHGFRSYAEGRDHSRRSWYGMGAVVAKPVRAGHVRALGLGMWQLMANVTVPASVDVLHLRQPRGLGRIAAFGQGFARGLSTPVDRATLKYMP
jgi:Glycosyltransferase like family 2